MKCIDDEIPFEIPEGWEWCRLKDMCSICTGATFKKDDATQSQRGTRILRGGNILPFQVKLKDDDIFIPSNLVKENILLKQNDIVTPAVTSLENIGKMARIEADMLNTTVGGFVFILRPYYNNDTLSQYMLFVMSAPPTVEYMRSITNKSGQAFYNIGKERLATTLIPLPPYAEQRRIVLTMSKTLPQVEKYAKHQTDLDRLNTNITVSLKKSILQEAIQGKLVPQDPNDEPASVLLERIREEKLRLLKEGKLKKKDITDSVIFKGEDNKYFEKIGKEIICIDDDIPFDIPISWEWVRLGNLFQHNTGKALNGSNQKGTLYEYITTSNLYWNQFVLDKLRQMPFTDEELEKCTVRKGDLLICEGGDIGRCAIWNYDYDIRIQNHIHRLRAFTQVCTSFFYYTMYLYKHIGLIGGKGIGIQGLSSNALHKLLLPLPPMNEQQRIVNKIELAIASIMRG